MSTALAGSALLLRATLRHDGRRFAPWIVIVTALSASSALAYPWLFPDAADRQSLAAALGANPALSLIFGPAFDLMSAEGFNTWRSLALGGFLTAMGSMLAVIHATRAQEDSGQAELLASGVLGRGSRLFAGVAVALIGSLAAGAIAGAVTVLCGAAWQPTLVLAATFTATGWMFAGVAAITAQLGSDARTASSLAVGALGALFALRGFAYAVGAPAWTVWINPLGWMTETRPASGSHWHPLLYAVALAAAALAVAFALQARRDFGQGAIAPRTGPARGTIRSTIGMVWALNRAPAIVWAVTFVLLGIVFGYFAASIRDLLSENSAIAGVLASGAAAPDQLISAFLVTIMSLVCIIAAIAGVQTMLRLRSEELAERVAPVLAGGVSRTRLFASTVLLAFIVPAVCAAGAGAIVAVFAASADIGIDVASALVQVLAAIPAMWTITAVSVLVVGARPQVSIAAWAGVLAAFSLTLLGPTFRLWDWALAISPFWHVPDVARGDSGIGLVWISLVTALLVTAGFAGFRRRDIAT